MATPNQLLDQYVIETIVKDETEAGSTSAQNNLNKTAKVARDTAAALSGVGDAGDDMATRVAKAVPSLDRMASRADDVTRALNAVKKAQTDYASAQQAAAREMATEDADLDKVNRTLAVYAQRLYAASQKLGEVRASAEATRVATEAWAGQIGQGDSAIKLFSNNVASLTQNMAMARNSSGALSAEMSNLRAAVDPVYRLSMQYAESFDKLIQLNASGAMGTKLYESKLAELNNTYQSTIDRLNGVGRATKSAADANDELRRKVDPVYRLSKDYESALNDLTEAKNKNIINDGVYSQQLAALNSGYQKSIESSNKLAVANNGAGYAARFLGIQFSQAISGIATGQGVFTVLIQQGHQLIDVFLASGKGLGDLGAAFMTMFRSMGGFPMAILIAGAVALYELTAAGESFLAMQNQLKVSLSGNHENYQQMANDVEEVTKRIATSTELSRDTVRKTAETFTSSKFFAGTEKDLEALVLRSRDVAAVMGVDVPEAAKILVGSFSDPIAAAEKLSEKFGGVLTPEFIRHLSTIRDVKDQYKELNLALDSVSANKAVEALGPIAKAWADLSIAVSGTSDIFKTITTFMAEDMAHFLREITELVNLASSAWRGLKEAAGTTYDFFKSAGNFIRHGGIVPDEENTTKPETKTEGSTNFNLTSFADVQKTIAQSIIDQLTQKYSAGQSQVAAVLSNAFRESAGFSKVNQSWIDSNGLMAGGMMSWNGPRLQDLFKFAGTNNISQIPLSTQVDFFMKEIETKWAKMWSDLAAMTPADAAVRLTTDYEKPKDTVGQARISAGLANRFTGRSDSPDLSVINQNQLDLRDIETAVKGSRAGLGGTAAEAGALTTEYQRLVVLQDKLRESTGSESVQYLALGQRLDEVRARLYANVDANTDAVRAAQSQFRSNEGLTGGERQLAAAMEARNQVALKSTGAGMTQAQTDEVRLEVSRRQIQVVDQEGAAAARLELQQIALGRAYEQSDQAIIDTTIKQEAYNKAIANSTAANFAEVLQKETVIAKGNYQSQLLLNESKANYTKTRELEYLKAETDTVGLGEEAQTKYLAVFKATVQAHKEDGAVLTERSIKNIELTKNIVDQTAAFNKQKSSLSELEGVYDTVMGDIANNIADAFAIGSDHALKFKDIATSVINDLEKEFLKLALINPLKNFLFGTNNPDLFSTGSILGQLLGFGGAAAAGSLLPKTISTSAGVEAALGGVPSLSGLSSAELAAANNATGATGGIGLLGGGSAAIGIVGFFDKIEGVFTKASTTLTTASNWVTNQLLSFTSTGGQAAANAVGAAGLTGTNSELIAAAISQGLGASDATAGAIASAAGQIAEALPYIGTAITVITDLATGNVRGAGFVAGGALVGGVIGTIAGGNTAAGVAIGSLIGSVLDMAFPQHPIHPFENTALDVAGGQLTVGASLSQVTKTDSARKTLGDYATSFNAYMKAMGILIDIPNQTIANFGSGITGFEQFKSIGEIFSRLRFRPSDASDSSTFNIAKQGLVGMNFTDVNALTAEIEKMAGFATTLDALGIRLEKVGIDLTSIQIGGVRQSEGPDKDLRIALQNDLTSQVFATTQALSDEIEKVNQFVNATVPGLLHPVETTTSSIVEESIKVFKTYEDAIAQAQAYGLAYTDALKSAEQEALDIVRKQGILAIYDQRTTINNAMRTVMEGNANYLRTTMENFDIAARNSMDAVKKLWTDTYGDIVNGTVAFVDAMNAEAALLGEQRIETLFRAQNAQEQARLTERQVETRITGRAQVLAGQPGTAALATVDLANALEMTQYKATLEAYYGISYVTTQEYLDKINALEKVQGEERAQIVEKYSTDITGKINLIFEKEHSRYTTAVTDFNTAKNTLVTAINSQISSVSNQISVIKQNTDALHNAATTLTNYTKGLRTGAQSPLTPEQILNAAQAEFNRQLGIMRGPGSIATRTAAAANATSAGSTLLDSAAKYFAQGTPNYNKIFDSVTGNLDDIAAGFEDQTGDSQKQIDLLQQTLDTLNKQLESVNNLGKAADADLKSLESTMVDKFNDMILALYYVNKVDPNATTLADAKRFSEQGAAYGLSDLAANQATVDKTNDIATAAAKVADASIRASANSNSMADLFYNSGGAQGLMFPDRDVQYNTEAYNVQSWFRNAGIEPTDAQLRAAIDDALTGSNPVAKINAHGYFRGGLVTNGDWNRDSVYTDKLAGGEFVINAPEAAKFSDILPAINAGTYVSSNSAILSELKALREEVAKLRAQTDQQTKVTAQGSLAIVGAINSDIDEKRVLQTKASMATKR